MKALLFVILAHFVLSDHHMEAENRRLRDANRALQQALKAMTSQESALGDWRNDHEEFALADSSDSDSAVGMDWGESGSFEEEEIGGRRRRRRRRRRRPKKLFTLEKTGHECSENTNEKYLGTFATVEECANACKARTDKVCHTFIYGKDYKKGWCYDEGVAQCPESEWEEDKYDFYALNRAEADEESAVGGGRPMRKGRL